MLRWLKQGPLEKDQTKEATANAPATPSEKLATHFYQQILGREPDAPGLAHHASLIDRIGLEEAVPVMLKAFLTSDEYRNRRVQTAASIHEVLSRTPAPAGRKKVQHIVSLGTHCLTSSILKIWGLKQYSLPFDWLFSSPRTILHCLEDDFRTFLDRSFYQPTIGASGDRAADHMWYLQNHQVRTMFAHRDPSTDADYQYFVRATARFRKLMRSDDGKLFVMVSEPVFKLQNHFEEISKAIRGLTRNASLVCVQLTKATGVPGSFAMKEIARDGDHALHEFTPSSANAGVGFPDALDDLAVLRLLHAYELQLDAGKASLGG